MHNMSVDQSRPELPQSTRLLGANVTNSAWCARRNTALNWNLPTNIKPIWLHLLSVEKLPFGLTPAKLHSIAWKGKLRKSLLLMQQMQVLLMPNLEDALTNTQLHTHTDTHTSRRFDDGWRGEHVFSLKPWIDHLWHLRWILCGRHLSHKHRMVSTNAGGGFVILLCPPKITLLSLGLVLTLCIYAHKRHKVSSV